MIKFWKEDFEYISRLDLSGAYLYTFFVRGESANYLINHYNLEFFEKCIVFCFMPDKSLSISGVKEDGNGTKQYVCHEEDREKLYEAVKDQISADLRNYEEYMCDDWYHRDSRWK